MSPKNGEISAPHLWYCLVRLTSAPDFNDEVYVVPSAAVAEVVSRSHETWITQPKRDGSPRKDTSMRLLRKDFTNLLGADTAFGAGWLDKYFEAWDQLYDPWTKDAPHRGDIVSAGN